MIPYHGTPMSPDAAAVQVLAGRHAMVSFARPDQIEIVSELCQSFALDNGAFSAWRAGKPVSDWTAYGEFVRGWQRHPGFDFALIPDVIDGSEEENDDLIAEEIIDAEIACPIWHLHESFERLERLTCWPRLALGSSGRYATIGTDAWWARMAQAMEVLCDDDGRPRTKLHGLRMLDPQIFSRFPFASADSTNIARNIGIDSKWRGTYQPPDKAWRGQVLAARVESFQSASRWAGVPRQHELQGLFAQEQLHERSVQG